jgi:uncharacterized damage-inducible protein DinB
MGVKVNQILEEVKTKRAELDALLAGIPREHWLEPLEPGGWTLKDILAHITWYEREVIPAFETHRMIGSELWSLPLEERNREIYTLNKGRSLEEVQAEAKIVFERFIQAAEKLDDEDLTDPSRFEFMPSDWKPYMLITTNSGEHYEDHIEWIKEWVER